MKRVIKIIVLYLMGISGLLLFYHLTSSEGVHDFLEQAERTRTDWSFGVFVVAVLIKYLLPIASIATILLTSYFALLRESDSD